MRMPDQPMREVTMPADAARVDMMSSGRFPTRTTSACDQTFSQIRRVAIKPVNAYNVN